MRSILLTESYLVFLAYKYTCDDTKAHANSASSMQSFVKVHGEESLIRDGNACISYITNTYMLCICIPGTGDHINKNMLCGNVCIYKCFLVCVLAYYAYLNIRLTHLMLLHTLVFCLKGFLSPAELQGVGSALSHLDVTWSYFWWYVVWTKTHQVGKEVGKTDHSFFVKCMR